MKSTEGVEAINQENSLLNLCYYYIIIYELVINSFRTLEKVKINENQTKEEFIKMLKENNRENELKYNKLKIQFTENIKNGERAAQLNKVKLYIEIDFEQKIENEEKVVEQLNKIIVSPIMTLLTSNKILFELLKNYFVDFYLESFSFIYNLIKLMKKNEDKNIGNLSIRYLEEQKKMEKQFQNEKNILKENIKGVKEELKKLKKEMNENSKENEKKIKEIIKENEQKCKELIEKKNKENEEKCKEIIEKNNKENEKKYKEIIEKNNKENEEKYKKLLEKNKKEVEETNKKYINIMKILKENEQKFQESQKRSQEMVEFHQNNFKEVNEQLNMIKKENLLFKDQLIKARESNIFLKNLNIDMIKKEMINQKLFDSYSNEISELKNINFQLDSNLLALKIILSKKESEINSLYGYIRLKGFLDEFQNLMKEK